MISNLYLTIFAVAMAGCVLTTPLVTWVASWVGAIDRPDQFLVTFTDGDHMIFSGRGRLRGGEKDAAFQELILLGSTAFWDAYLKQASAARRWLAGSGFRNALGTIGVFETKARQLDQN